MPQTSRARSRWRGAASLPVVVALGSALAAAGVTALLVTIVEHKDEAKSAFFRVVAIDDKTDDASLWGKNFPLQFELYKKTALQAATRFGGSREVAHVPTAADPRTVVTQSKIEEDPRLKTMWAGYAFATDYRKKRGHEFMLLDQTYTERVLKFKQPGSCLHCHGSMYNVYRDAGGGDLMKGFAKVNAMPFQEARKLVAHPVGCIDCHVPETMQLRVTRPAFLEGIKALKASQGVPNYDPNTMATRQEMRTYVCGQCHVEYYFKGADKQLTLPWSKGLAVDQIADYYDEAGFKDWTHALTGAPTLKAQHPEFETWSMGIHARSGVVVRGLPHALHEVRRAEDLRSSGEEPAPQRQQVLPDVPPLERARAQGPGRADPDAVPAGQEHRARRPHGPHRGPEGREGCRPVRRRPREGARLPAAWPVLHRLHRRRELHGLPRAAGVRARSSPSRSTSAARARTPSTPRRPR